MGGALALYTGYNFVTNIKGVFAISSFLNKGSIVFNHLQLNTLPGKN